MEANSANSVQGSEVKAARRTRGWTQKQLSERVDASVPTISQIEHGLHRPRPDLEQRLVAELGLERSPWPAREQPPDVPRGGSGVPGCRDEAYSIPYGRCHCGCGKPTTIVAETVRPRNLLAGEPHLYLHGHKLAPCGHRGCSPSRCRWESGYLGARDGGERLRKAREAKGWSQRQLGRVAIVDYQIVCNLEGIAGTRTTRDVAGKIAKKLGVTLFDLFTSESSDTRPTARKRTRPAMKAGDIAKEAHAALERYCVAKGLWTGRRAAKELGLDERMVSYLAQQGRLEVAERYKAVPFSPALYRPDDVMRFARERQHSDDHRVLLDPWDVYNREYGAAICRDFMPARR